MIFFMAVSSASTIYKHTQKGGLFLYLNGFFTLLSIVAFCYVLTMIKAPCAMFGLIVLGMVIIFLVLSTLAMSSLTVSIDNEFVSIMFGSCVFAKKFALKDISDCKPVKNDFWNNWGIRMCGNGWLYNVAGFDAVEITLISGKQHRIGTDEPQQLAEAIQSIISKISTGGV